MCNGNDREEMEEQERGRGGEGDRVHNKVFLLPQGTKNGRGRDRS